MKPYILIDATRKEIADLPVEFRGHVNAGDHPHILHALIRAAGRVGQGAHREGHSGFLHDVDHRARGYQVMGEAHRLRQPGRRGARRAVVAEDDVAKLAGDAAPDDLIGQAHVVDDDVADAGNVHAEVKGGRVLVAAEQGDEVVALDAETLPEEYKSKICGVAKIENGKVTEIDGEEVSLPSYDSLKGNFNFSKGSFKNVEDKNGKFTANVIDPSNLLGTQTESVSNMKITVCYNNNAIESILLIYDTGKSHVTTEYIFGV